MTRSILKGLTIAATLSLVAQTAWSVDPRLNTAPGRNSTVPSSNDPAARLVQPGGFTAPATQISSNQSRDRLGNVLVPDPTRYEYNPTRPSSVDTLRVTPQISPNPQLNPGTGLQPQPTPQTPQQQQPRWRLGVYSKDTSTGVQIVQVVQNGSAQRAGLEKDDIILSVNGFQVGYVNGTLYDCGTEFERLADKNGWVNMLVFDNRGRTLTNLPVQLDSRLKKLSGTLNWRDAVSLPPRSTAVVEIRERARVGAPTTILARSTIEQIRQNSIPFEIEYDPALIDPNRSYIISAFVVNQANQMLFQSSVNSNYQLTNLGAGQNRPITVALERVGGYDVPVAQNPQYGNQEQYVTQEQLETLFQTILERNPTQREMEAWLSSIRSGQSLKDVQATLLANNQVFNQVDRDKTRYVEKLHELLLDRKPTREELTYWTQRFDELQGIRSDVAREFIASVAQN